MISLLSSAVTTTLSICHRYSPNKASQILIALFAVAVEPQPAARKERLYLATNPSAAKISSDIFPGRTSIVKIK